METPTFIPALGYDFLSEYYDLTIKLTMPEKQFRNKVGWLCEPAFGRKHFGIWLWYSSKPNPVKTKNVRSSNPRG